MFSNTSYLLYVYPGKVCPQFPIHFGTIPTGARLMSVLREHTEALNWQGALELWNTEIPKDAGEDSSL